ncbi:MAG: tetratricopeptide repeat protein [Leptolyngbya sp.]|nr:tetratricopeptide repeat protein [Candidatus Melainabacteria bacterium]
MKFLQHIVRPRAVLLSYFALFMVAAPAYAGAADQLREGIVFYDKKNYAAAQDVLSKAVTGEFRQSALAHYYLANSLMQLRRTNAAVVEYEQAYQLAPFSTFSGYCRQMLTRYGKTAPSVVKVPSASSARSIGPDTVSNDSAAGGISSEKKPFEEDLLRQLASRMPPIPKPEIENPPTSVILAGTLFEKSQFISEALARKNRATERLEQARALLTRAEAQSHSQIVSARSFGETDAALKERRANSEKLVSDLVQPFRNNVTNAERAFDEESRLYESCLNARMGY